MIIRVSLTVRVIMVKIAGKLMMTAKTIIIDENNNYNHNVNDEYDNDNDNDRCENDDTDNDD